jgi:hypothetical protein
MATSVIRPHNGDKLRRSPAEYEDMLMDHSPHPQPPQTGITATPPAAPFDRPAADVALQPSERWEHVWGAVMMVLIHGFIIAVLLAYLLVFVQRYKRAFIDFGMKLPWAAVLVIDISNFVSEFFVLLPFLLLPPLLADGVVLYFIRRQRRGRTLARLLFLAILLVLLVCLAAVVTVSLQPYFELMEGLDN